MQDQSVYGVHRPMRRHMFSANPEGVVLVLHVTFLFIVHVNLFLLKLRNVTCPAPMIESFVV